MYKTLTIFLVLTISFSYGQGTKIYNNIINKAENDIINKDYKGALLSYKELKKQDYIFSRDIYNAVITSNKVENWDELNYWGDLFLQKGAVLQFFKQYKFKKFRKTKFWENLSKSEIVNQLDKQLIKNLDSLTSLDQNQFSKLKVNPETKVYDLTAEIDKKMFLLEKKHGKITEDNAGINISRDSVYSFRPKYAVLYRHSYQSHQTNSFFKEKVKNNELERILYYNSIDYNLMPIIEYKNKLYFLRENMLPSEYKEDFVNFQRITKIAYKNKEFEEFSFYYPIFKFADFVDDESRVNFEQSLKELYLE